VRRGELSGAGEGRLFPPHISRVVKGLQKSACRRAGRNEEGKGLVNSSDSLLGSRGKRGQLGEEKGELLGRV